MTADVFRCRVCGALRDRAQFVTRKNGQRAYQCRTCDVARVTAWHAAHPAQSRANHRKSARVYKAKHWYQKLLSDCRKHATDRGLECSLTPGSVVRMWVTQNCKCFWFGIQLVPDAGRRDPQKPSLDRLDPSRGYTEDNVVLASAAANRARSDVSTERFREFCELVLSQRSKAEAA